MSKSLLLPLTFERPETIWFGARSCVVVRGETREVIVGGFLLGRFSPGDVVARNVLLTTLAADDTIHLGQLTEAFGLSPEAGRQIRRLHEEHGIEAVVGRRGPGRQSEVTENVRLALEKLFSEGATVSAAFKKLGPKKARSRSTVGRIRKNWKGGGRVAPAEAKVSASLLPAQAVEHERPSPPAELSDHGSSPRPRRKMTPVPQPRNEAHVQHPGLAAHRHD